MKSFFKTLALASVFLIGITAPGFAGDTIKLGSGGVISGDLAPYGISAVRGVEIAIEDINAKGGILGKQIELLVGDDVCKPEVSVNMATKLVSDGAQMIVGHVCSGATIAANKIYKDAGLLVVSPASTNDDLTLKGEHPNFFRTISYDGAQADLMTSFIKNVLKVKTVALIHDKGDYGKGQMELAKNYFEKLGGIEVVLFEGVTTGAVDYTAIVQKIKRTNAELTMWGGYHSDASKIVGLIKKKKVDTIFFGADGIIGDNFVNLAGKYSEGVYATGPNDTSGNALFKELTAKHQKKYSEDPGTFFYNAYACVQALAAAAEKAESLDYDKMRAAMFEIKIDSPLGPIGFDNKGDVVGAGFSVYQVQNGKYTQVN
ncbi:MAG: branched-chain amino acid ABC transporter substrate-binding protein [Proteobacteria bacterium]|nr:branched-chain amino acid ABC transporter substrate-binding protein [Pseudomonadota bacterium]MBU1584939.1 branched-chain amino acid ABC transporter substrate-binding protein [Pseudomonadota bacterium]MBU2452796.1 branched-chain amino acid ABC transporter substrate-binding protein [Pseudomonadota bacterium]MBU2627747.1 branched-chain amino acid ABC transporter substrate-binding protein [Pseudomonadota bacterium]